MFRRTGRIWHLHVAGQLIRTTGEHPFCVYNKGWIAANELQPGDLLSSHDGQWVAVEEVYDTGEFETVYNLRVADFHTYFVGAEHWGFSVWAHNATYAEQQQLRQELEAKAQHALDAIKVAEKLGIKQIAINEHVLRTQAGRPDKGKRGPVLTVLKDLETGEFYYGQNQGQRPQPGDLHPVLQKRLDEYLALHPERAQWVLPDSVGIPGSHAEVIALNKALMARPANRPVTEADLGQFALFNIRSETRQSGMIGTPIIRCDACRTITQGVIAWRG